MGHEESACVWHMCVVQQIVDVHWTYHDGDGSDAHS